MEDGGYCTKHGHRLPCPFHTENHLDVAIVALRDIAKGLHMIESREVAQKALDIIGPGKSLQTPRCTCAYGFEALFRSETERTKGCEIHGGP